VPQEKYAKPELCKRINELGVRTLAYRRGRQAAIKRFGDCNDSLQHVGCFAGMHHQEHVMNTNKDQVKGRLDEAEGKIKEVTGKVVGDKKLEVKGKVQEIGGEARAKLGDIKQHVKDSLKKDA
jgi:uncharacterized protein YjbJ (UPF0337 family)